MDENATPQPPPGLHAAAERNAQAVLTGNIAQLMADITPEALAAAMQMAPAGGVSFTAMPGITSYELKPQGPDGDAFVYHEVFQSALGKATMEVRWREIIGQWRIVGLKALAIEMASGSSEG